MLREFLIWWMGQLRALLPARLARQDGPATAIVVEPGPAAGIVTVAMRRDRQESPIGRFAFDEAGLSGLRRVLSRPARPPLVLRVPAAQLLEREVGLPLAAERDLGNALRYGLDSMTPFAADEVFWDWAVLDRDRVRGRVRLLLSLVPRAPLRPLLDALDRIGAPPGLLEVRGPDGSARAFVPDGSHRTAPRASLIAAAGLCAVLAVVAATLPFVQQARALAAAEARIATLRPAVAQAEALRRRLADDTGGADVVARERARVGDPLAEIAAVTDILPDDTWLSEFSLRNRRLLLAGQSVQAPRLIAALSADPTLRNPSFAAPVTRAPNGTGELFSIQADLAP